MMYIVFIAAILVAAGVTGGIEAVNTVGIAVAAVIHIGRMVCMAAMIMKRRGRRDGKD